LDIVSLSCVYFNFIWPQEGKCPTCRLLQEGSCPGHQIRGRENVR